MPIAKLSSARARSTSSASPTPSSRPGKVPPPALDSPKRASEPAGQLSLSATPPRRSRFFCGSATACCRQAKPACWRVRISVTAHTQLRATAGKPAQQPSGGGQPPHSAGKPVQPSAVASPRTPRASPSSHRRWQAPALRGQGRPAIRRWPAPALPPRLFLGLAVVALVAGGLGVF